MTTKEAKKEIIKILKNSPFKGTMFEGQCEFWADDLVVLLFTQIEEAEKKMGEALRIPEWDKLSGANQAKISIYTGFGAFEGIKETLNKKIENYLKEEGE